MPLKPDATSVFTGYDRAKRVVPTLDGCEWAQIGGCGGPLQRAHLDGNPLNNVRENIKVLCNSHHFLYDKGRIDPANPVMPEFFISGGKRRYRPRLTQRICKLASCGKPFASESTARRYCSPICAAVAHAGVRRAIHQRYVAKKRGHEWTAPCR